MMPVMSINRLMFRSKEPAETNSKITRKIQPSRVSQTFSFGSAPGDSDCIRALRYFLSNQLLQSRLQTLWILPQLELPWEAIRGGIGHKKSVCGVKHLRNQSFNKPAQVGHKKGRPPGPACQCVSFKRLLDYLSSGVKTQFGKSCLSHLSATPTQSWSKLTFKSANRAAFRWKAKRR